jgi:hypothetical protein
MILVCFFAVNARQGIGRREREGGFPKTDATTILADEQKGVFRVLDIGRPRPAGILLPQCFLYVASSVSDPESGSGSSQVKMVSEKSK